jgi:hypothetical protein
VFSKEQTFAGAVGMPQRCQQPTYRDPSPTRTNGTQKAGRASSVPLLIMDSIERRSDISCPCCDVRKNKREGCAYLKPPQTLTTGIAFGRPYSAPFSAR